MHTKVARVICAACGLSFACDYRQALPDNIACLDTIFQKRGRILLYIPAWIQGNFQKLTIR
jgi:hypothetical protein